MKKKINPWTVLGIEPDSPFADVKKAYKEKSHIHHPDKGGNIADWLKLSDAYETIKQSNYVPILQSNSTQMVSINLSIREQILGMDDIIVVESDSKELYINVSIPPGAVKGDKFKVAKDDQNYIINIKEKAHLCFTRQGTSLIMYKKLSIVDVLKRTPIVIESPTEELIEIDLPDELQTGSILTLPGHGLYNRKTRKRGSLKIHLQIDIPVLNEHNTEDFITRLKND